MSKITDSFGLAILVKANSQPLHQPDDNVYILTVPSRNCCDAHNIASCINSFKIVLLLPHTVNFKDSGVNGLS